MRVAFVRLILRLVAIIDGIWLHLRARKAVASLEPRTAGAGIQSAKPVETIVLGPVVWPGFPTLAHAFWRAQELTLFRDHCHLFSSPAVDLGCGDMVFGRLAGFPENGFGVDYDFGSLLAAGQMKSPQPRIRADAGRLPLADAGLAVCLSNSVLEHLPDLDRCFAEVRRILKPGGLFLFSMTLGVFTSQLKFWTGQRDTELWLRTFGHLQQPGEEELLKKLCAQGFSIRACTTYQGLWTTAIYRFLVSPCFQFIERRCVQSVRNRLRIWLTPRVVGSLRNTSRGEGACLFVVACKN